MARVEFRWSEELLAAVDRARGDVPRAAFVRRAVEAALPLEPPERDAHGNVIIRGKLKQMWKDDRLGVPAPSEADVPDVVRNVRTGEEVPVTVTPETRGALAHKALNRFKCGCSTSAVSPSAKCPKHGRSLA